MGKYYIKFGISDKPNAGAKAMHDIMNLLNKHGYRPVLSLPTNAIKLIKIIDIPILIFTILFKIRRNGTLIYFVPSNTKRIRLLQIMQHYLGFKLICFINDIEFMRMERNQAQANEEIKAISAANIILVPNYNSVNILQKAYNMTQILIPICVWDYLSPTYINDSKYNKDIAFAGNLSKAPFIKQLPKVSLSFSIWGRKDESIKETFNIIFHGERKPNELINEIALCAWGLVWDGESIDTCSGLLGNYLRFNNSHKCGLYLAAGIPLIVWKESGMAHFVNENKVGICVESLFEAESIIKNMNEDTYNKYRNNAQRIGENIRHGHYFLEALRKAESISL